jgi:hypothetical protein
VTVQTYTVAGFANPPRDWETANGQFRSFYLKVEGDDKVYELAQKRDKPAPNVGDSFEATVEAREVNGSTFYKLKKHYAPRGNNGGRPSKDPAERESIERQVAAKTASDLLVGLMSTGWKPESAMKLADLHTVLAAQIAKEIKTP